jgi:hypothetical protein
LEDLGDLTPTLAEVTVFLLSRKLNGVSCDLSVFIELLTMDFGLLWETFDFLLLTDGGFALDVKLFLEVL